MITVHILPPAYGLPSVSPYCAKLIAWMEIAGIEHEVKGPDFAKAPHGKVPFVVFDGKRVGDTHVIQRLLRERLGKGLPAIDDPVARGRAHAAQKLAQEGVYWTLVYSRWWDEDGWAPFRPVVDAMVPAPLRFFVTPLIRRKTRKQMWEQGVARLPKAEIYADLERDLDAIVALLGDGPFLGGEQPSDYDLGVWAPVASGLATPWGGPVADVIRARAPLVDFVNRIDARRQAGGTS